MTFVFCFEGIFFGSTLHILDAVHKNSSIYKDLQALEILRKYIQTSPSILLD